MEKGHEKESEIESLARMVAEGFGSIENRFDAMEERFEKLEAKVDETNRLIDKVLIPTLDDHGRRIKDLEVEVFAHQK